MPTTCLICCQQAQVFLLPPCNHKQMCWRCSLKLIEGSTFTCPYCNGTPEGTSSILFVSEEEMAKFSFQEVLKRNPYKSATKSYQCYSNAEVAQFIQQQTSNFCRLCMAVFDNINMLKKHLNEVHRKQFCDVCLENRKCLLSDQYLYSEGQLTAHLKKGEYNKESNEIVLYHPYCDFCKSRFYDSDAFRVHLRMSSHLKCEICQQNYPKLKYVYYKDYNEIQKHFYKSHFVCQIGACLGNKLQNVFVSQHLLEEHKNRVHNKGSKNNHKQVLNLLLFEQKEEQFEWDKIGKDFSKEFMALEKSYTMKNQQHRDSLIDIRAFYPQLTKANNKMSLDQVKDKLQQFLFRTDFQSQNVSFTSVPIFNPLQMASVTRFELQKFLRGIYEPKYSEPLVEIFFTRKFDYRSQSEYFLQIRRRMWAFSPISYYYAFPQLVRFFKDTNRTKISMDQFYAQSLRNLKINRVFVFHKKDRYSDIFNMLQDQIESHIYQLMIEDKINLYGYQKYLKDLNPEYYQQVHWQLFYVQREKILNLYHMIEKTKTSQILKLNWLLKLGLSSPSYKAIYDKFYYRTVDDCGQWAKAISLQELALIYAYVDICLQSFIDKKVFNTNKSNPHALFLGTVLSKTKTCISLKQLTALKHLEEKSNELASKLSSCTVATSKKNTVINEEEHPSLLSSENQKPTHNEQSMVLFGQNVNLTSNSHIRVNRKNQNRVQESSEDFPELFVKKEKKQLITKDDEEFPVFNYQYKEPPQQVPKKKKYQQEQKSNIEKLELFNPKNAFTSRKIAEQFYEKKERQYKQKQKQREVVKQSRGWQDEWPTLNDEQDTFAQQANIQKSTKKKKKKQKEAQQKQVIEQKVQTPTITEHVFKKKTKEELRAEEQGKSKKQKIKKAFEQESTLAVEPAQQKEDRKQRRRKVRLDATDSEDEDRKQAEQKKAKRQQKHRAFMEEQKIKLSLKYHDGFDSLLQSSPKTTTSTNTNAKATGGVSIINELIKENKKQDKQPEIVIKKGKKGKTVVIEKVDIWKL